MKAEDDVMPSVGAGSKLSKKVMLQRKENPSDQRLLTFIIKYGTYIGLLLFTFGTMIQLYLK